ncbi:MAG TPA: hypothetical protein VE343_17395, partial [Streptosporangiaceae bacterium]|nr:hypothetical protein [Streptosporangiaceae bacterium]
MARRWRKGRSWYLRGACLGGVLAAVLGLSGAIQAGQGGQPGLATQAGPAAQAGPGAPAWQSGGRASAIRLDAAVLPARSENSTATGSRAAAGAPGMPVNLARAVGPARGG